jgi:hypothetical protein
MTDDNELFKRLQEGAKEALRQKKEHPPTFFLEAEKDGKKALAIMPVNIGNDEEKSALAANLPRIVEELKCEKYYAVFDAFMASPEASKARAKKIMKDLEAGKMEPGAAAEQMIDLQNRPSKHPLRTECLVVMMCTKNGGTEVEVFPYDRKKVGKEEQIVFKPLPKPKKNVKKEDEGVKNAYNRWNVWNQYEVTVEDGQ